MPTPTLEFDLRKTDWHPASLQDVADQVSHAFESPVTLGELPIIGTNHIERTRIWSDDALVNWMRRGSSSQSSRESEEERVISVTAPSRVLPVGFRPGEAPILAKGRRTDAFDGDGRADARLVDFQLRIFDCGHFYMKQSLSNSSSSLPPYWVIFEGRWRRSGRGYRLIFHFKYPRTAARCLDFTIHGLPGRNEASLNYSGDDEVNLKGFLPTIVGNDATCWAALKRREDKKKQASLRNDHFGEKDDDDDDNKDRDDSDEEEEEERFNGPEKQELVQGLLKELNSEQQQELRHALGTHGMTPELYRELSPPLRQALQRLQRRASMAQRRRDHAEEGEPTWPMYLGMVLFVFVFAVFAYIWFEEHYSGEVAEDIDEDAYWKKDDFL